MQSSADVCSAVKDRVTKNSSSGDVESLWDFAIIRGHPRLASDVGRSIVDSRVFFG